MRKISTSIILSIVLSVIIATVLVGGVTLVISSDVVLSESNDKVEAIARQYRNDMDTSFEKYQSIVKGVAEYIQASYDVSKKLDTQYDKEYMEVVSGYLQNIANDYKDEILCVQAYVDPKDIKEIIGAKYINGEFVETNTEDEYMLYFTDSAEWVWYDTTDDNKAPTWIKPHYDSVTKENCMTYAYPLYDDNNKIYAMVGINIKFSRFSDMVKELKVYNTGFASLIDDQQQYIVDDTHDVNENLTSAGYKKLSEAVKSNDSGIMKEGTEYLAYANLANGFTILIHAPEAEVNESSYKVIKFAAIIGIAVCALSIMLALIIGKKISKPIVDVVEDLQKMENGDFTGTRYKKHSKRKNETGKLARAVGAVQIAMNETVGMVSESGENIVGAVTKLDGVVNSLVDRVSGISAVSEELAASMEETAATAETLSNTSDNIMSHIERMNYKNQEGKNQISRISDRATVIKAEAEESSKLAMTMTKDTEVKLRHAIEESKRVKRISELTGAIMEIADETSLLSMNASIEAARAGESGKGFVVVADQIRKLAENSESMAKQIQTIAEEVTQTVNNLCQSSTEVLEFISTNVKDTNQKLMDTSEQYNADANDIQILLNEFSAIAGEISDEITGIIQAFEELKNATAEGATGTTAVAEDADELAVNTNTVQDEVVRLRETASKLEAVIQRFTV